MKYRNDRDYVTTVTVARATSKSQRRDAEDAEFAEEIRNKDGGIKATGYSLGPGLFGRE
jgi:hypothetical protein